MLDLPRRPAVIREVTVSGQSAVTNTGYNICLGIGGVGVMGIIMEWVGPEFTLPFQTF